MKKQKKSLKVQEKKEVNKSFLENNKNFLIILGIIILAILAIVIIKNITTGKAIGDINPNNPEDPLGIGLNPENLPQTPEDAKTAASNYLKKEWGKILADSKYIGPIIKGYNNYIGPWLNPALKVILGVEPSISWLFALTLIIWITLITFFYRILSVFSTFSKWVSFIISVCTMVIASILKIPLYLANKIISLIGILTSWWMQAIAIAALIVGLILISMFSKQWAAMIKKIKENRKKMKIEMEVEMLKAQGKSQAEIQKIITDTFGEVGKAFTE